MVYEIYSIGDPAFLSETLKATTVILNRDGLAGIVAIGFLVTFVWTIVQGVLTGGREIKIQNIVMAGIIYAAFFGVKVERVNIWPINGGLDLYQVEDVPLGLAFSGTMISKVGNSLTEWFEQEYTAIGFGTSNLGPNFALKALYQMRGLGFGDGSLRWDPAGNFTKSITNYVNDCVIPGTTLHTQHSDGSFTGYPAINLAEVMLKEDAWQHLKWNNGVWTTKVYQNTDSPTPNNKIEVLPCNQAYDKITNYFQATPDLMNNWLGYIGESTCNEAGYQCSQWKLADGSFDNNGFASEFTVMRDAILGVDVELDKLLLNRALARAVNEVGAKYAVGTGDALLSAVAERATANITMNQALQQTMFERMMLPLMTFFESLMFVAAPFAAILVAFGLGGLKMIGKYLVFALWIQLWKPVTAVGNMFIQMSVSREMDALSGFATSAGESLASIARQPEAFEALSHWIGVGGMLVASTPMITLMLMYGSAVTASSLAGRIDMGKNADVGMDGFSGKSQVGDAGASLTKETGAVAFTNSQASDATQGAVSMGAAYAAQAQNQQMRAQAESVRAEASQGKALDAIASASVASANTKSEAINQDGKVVNSQDYAEKMTDGLISEGRIEQSDRQTVAAGIKATASAGFDIGKITKQLQKAGIDTKSVEGKDGKISKSRLGMVMSMLKGDVGVGGDYQDRFDRAAAQTERLSNVVDQKWDETETERKQWGSGFTQSDQNSLTESKDWRNAQRHSNSYQESQSRADEARNQASNLEALSQSSGAEQRFELAALSADVANNNGLGQFQQFLSAKQQQGDSAYSGIEANASGYRQAARIAAGQGKSNDLSELLSMAGHNVSSQAPLPSASEGLEARNNSSGRATVDGVGERIDGERVGSVGRNGDWSVGGMWQAGMNSVRELAEAKNPNLIGREEMGVDQAQQRMIDEGGLGQGEYQGVNKDKEDIRGQKADAVENSDIRKPGGIGKAMLDFLDTGIPQKMAERSSEGSGIGSAAGAAAGTVSAVAEAQALKQAGKSVAAGVLRGALSGGMRGGAWGAVAGAAWGAAEGYMKYRDQLATDKASKELEANKGGDLSKISAESHDVINQTLEGLIARQVHEMSSAARSGQEFDHEGFYQSLNDFEKQVYDQSEHLLGSGQGYGDKLGMTMAEAIDKQAEMNEAKQMGFLTQKY